MLTLHRNRIQWFCKILINDSIEEENCKKKEGKQIQHPYLLALRQEGLWNIEKRYYYV